MRRTDKLAITLVFGFACAVIGGRIENDSEPVSPASAPSVPKVIVEKHVVKVPKLPEDCRRAFEMSVRVRSAAEDYDTTTGKQLDIMDESVKAIFEHNYKALNDLVTRQRTVRDATIPASDVLHRELAKFDLILAKCDQQIGG